MQVGQKHRLQPGTLNRGPKNWGTESLCTDHCDGMFAARQQRTAAAGMPM